ncbi:MAG: ATP-binding protein [bacterium]
MTKKSEKEGEAAQAGRLEDLNQELLELQDAILNILRDVEISRKQLEELNKILEERVKERTYELSILQELSQRISYVLDYRELFRIIFDFLHRVVEFDLAGAVICHGGADEVIVRLAKPISREGVEQFHGILLKGFYGISGDEYRECRVMDARFRRVEGFERSEEPLRGRIESFFNAPLIVEGRADGIIGVASLKENAFNQNHIRMIDTVANQASASVHRLRMALESERSRIESIVENIAEGIILMDMNRRVRVINPVGREMVGVLAGDRSGETLDYLGVVPVADLIYSVLDDPQVPLKREIEAPDGSGRAFVLEASPVLGGEDEAIGVVIVLRDVTRDRFIQEQILQMEKLSAVGGLVAGVAHELNNPLTGVMGFAQLLLMEPDLREDVKEDIRKIYREGDRARRIVQNLLAFARKHKPEKRLVDVNHLIENTLELQSYEARANNIRVVKNLDRELPMILADPNQLQQVFLNITSNAYQAMLLRDGERCLTVTTRREGGEIEISFSDTGPGIPRENLKRIFDPFFTTKEVGEGTGLGLSVSYGIIREHGGTITVKSWEGEGATFTILLPLLGGIGT